MDSNLFTGFVTIFFLQTDLKFGHFAGVLIEFPAFYPMNI
jgi:hypothetical protein